VRKCDVEYITLDALRTGPAIDGLNLVVEVLLKT